MANIFNSLANKAIINQSLQKSLNRLNSHFILARQKAVLAKSDYYSIRAKAKLDKNKTLNNWHDNILLFEKQLNKNGGSLHFANTKNSANEIILELLKKYNSKKLIKSKSMISEEVGVNEYLKNKIPVIETDLGEYIIQLRDEKPSHIIAPAFHLNKEQIAKTFKTCHKELDKKRDLSDPTSMLKEVRKIMRAEFLSADTGLTGANMLIAETGTIVLVTNEGNADLLHSRVKHMIVISSIDKVINKVSSANNLIRLLARNATGQNVSVYTSYISGSRRSYEQDGAQTLDVILLDNTRTSWLNTPYQDLLRCIRCGACINHCPVYSKIGGHAYGTIYPGPIGSALSHLVEPEAKSSSSLPFASSFCGRCEEVCPMSIPLVSILRHSRSDIYSKNDVSLVSKYFQIIFGFVATKPKLYHFLTGVALKYLSLFGSFSKTNYLPKHLGLSNWQKFRKIEKLPKRSFLAGYKSLQKNKFGG